MAKPVHWNDGENNGRARFTARGIRIIRAALRNGVPSSELAKLYGVHHSTIGLIKRKKTWKDVP